MNTKFFLKKSDGTYYSLNDLSCESKDKARATQFKTSKTALYWLNNHTISFVPVKDCGFELSEESS